MSGIITFQLCLISHIWIIFCPTEKLPRTNHKVPLRILPITLRRQITNISLPGSEVRNDGEKENRAESEDERAPTLQNTTEIVRNVSYVLPPSDSLSATSLLLSPPSPPSSLHPRLDSAQLFSLKRHSNDQSEKITPQREQLVKYPSSLSSLKHLSKGQ